jgi:hypothetical protein
MSWTVTLPGQPPSANHMYERQRGGQQLRKKPGIEAYQADVTRFVRLAKPSGWKPGLVVIVSFWFVLGRDVDCTNAIKIIEDGIAEALCPGIEPPTCCRSFDRRFLPRAMGKSIGTKVPFVRVEIE